MRPLIIFPLLFALSTPHLFAAWRAGIARAEITPTESVPLAGYGGKSRLSLKVEHPIWLKALAVRDDRGTLAVLVTSDLVGLSTKMVDRIAGNALEKHHVSRQNLILNSSHNHSCPITEDVLHLYYELTPEEAAARDRYTRAVYERYDQVIAAAISDLVPAELAFEQGLAGIAVNRRRSPGAEARKLGGQVDQDVPVLTVRHGGILKGIVFGYSCHPTTLSETTISGDYPGFAQIELEKTFAGAVAMFVQNCGGDANPLPRIIGENPKALEFASAYGKILAESVRQVISGKMVSLSGPLLTALEETELHLQPGPSLKDLKEQLPTLSGLPKRAYEHLIRQYETNGALPARVQYPVQVWRFGPELAFIALTGETVVDYSLKLKSTYGWSTTWVCGYNNDLLSYVPSLRVLKEGGYEGTGGMLEYGLRAPYTDCVEEQITAAVKDLMSKTAVGKTE